MKSGFTLIELLVVITIIVVLLALLTPSLHKAIYQAELVQCASRIRILTNAALSYSIDEKRAYPYRSAVHDPEAAYSSSHFRNADSGGGAGIHTGVGGPVGLIGHDDRPESSLTCLRSRRSCLTRWPGMWITAMRAWMRSPGSHCLTP